MLKKSGSSLIIHWGCLVKKINGYFVSLLSFMTTHMHGCCRFMFQQVMDTKWRCIKVILTAWMSVVHNASTHIYLIWEVIFAERTFRPSLISRSPRSAAFKCVHNEANFRGGKVQNIILPFCMTSIYFWQKTLRLLFLLNLMRSFSLIYAGSRQHKKDSSSFNGAFYD